MKKIRGILKNNKAFSSIELLTSYVVIIGVVSVFFISVNTFYTSYERNIPDAYEKNIQISDRIITETGMDKTEDSRWENSVEDPIEDLVVFGLAQEPVYLSILNDIDGNGAEITFFNSGPLPIENYDDDIDLRSIELGPIIGIPGLETITGINNLENPDLIQGKQVWGDPDSTWTTTFGQKDILLPSPDDDSDETPSLNGLSGGGNQLGFYDLTQDDGEGGEDYYYVYGWTSSYFYQTDYPFDFAMTSRLETDSMGCIDKEKINKLNEIKADYIDDLDSFYNIITEKLGYGSEDDDIYELYLKIDDFDDTTADPLLEFGNNPDDSSNIVTSVNKPIGIFDDSNTENAVESAIFTIIVYQN